MFIPSQRTKTAWLSHSALAYSFEIIIFACTLADLFLAILHGTQLYYTSFYPDNIFLHLYEGMLPVFTLILVTIDLVVYGVYTLKPGYSRGMAICMALLWAGQSAGWMICDITAIMQYNPLCSEASMSNYGSTSFSVLLPQDPLNFTAYWTDNKEYAAYDPYYDPGNGPGARINVISVSINNKIGKVAVAICISLMYLLYSIAACVIIRRRKKSRICKHTCSCHDEADMKPENDSAPHSTTALPSLSNARMSHGIAFPQLGTYSASYAPTMSYGVSRQASRAASTVGLLPEGSATGAGDVSYAISVIDETEEGYAPSVSSHCFSIDTRKTCMTALTLNSTVVGSDSSRRDLMGEKEAAVDGARDGPRASLQPEPERPDQVPEEADHVEE